MRIIIQGKEAAIKSGTSFDYIQENRLFSDADGFTLDIILPLAGCPANQDIFGHINRMDATTGNLVADAELIAAGFRKQGCVVVTQINATEVKAQFLEGKSARSYYRGLDDIYINEMTLGTPANHACTDNTPPDSAWDPARTDETCVALPWWNTNSDGDELNNEAVYINPKLQDGGQLTRGRYEWHPDQKKRSWFPYLLFMLRKIFEIAGYEADLSALEAKSAYRYLLICQTLPASWGVTDFGRILPHWTIEELLQHLELFLDGVFHVDGVTNTVTFRFNADTMAALPVTRLTDIIDEFTTDVTADNDSTKCDFISTKTIKYEEQETETWKYLDCRWFLEAYPTNCLRYATWQGFYNAMAAHGVQNSDNHGYAIMTEFGHDGWFDAYYYIEEFKTYFIWRPLCHKLYGGAGTAESPYIWRSYYKLQPLNECGPRVGERDDDDAESIGIIPADIEFTDLTHGEVLFVDVPSYSESDIEPPESWNYNSGEWGEEMVGAVSSWLIPVLMNGKKEQPEYFSNLTLGWYRLHSYEQTYTDQPMPHPWVEKYQMTGKVSHASRPTPFRINDRTLTVPGVGSDFRIDTKKVYKISWLTSGNELPDPMGLFLIHGKRYLCKQIKATFTEHGMSRKLEGEFYRLRD